MKLATTFNPGYLYAIAAAILFGASTPVAKFLVSKIHPLFLAGIFYLSSGIIICIILVAKKLFTHVASGTSLRRRDIKCLVIATLCGGILAPVLLMVGLTKTSASSAA